MKVPVMERWLVLQDRIAEKARLFLLSVQKATFAGKELEFQIHVLLVLTRTLLARQYAKHAKLATSAKALYATERGVLILTWRISLQMDFLDSIFTKKEKAVAILRMQILLSLSMSPLTIQMKLLCVQLVITAWKAQPRALNTLAHQVRLLVQSVAHRCLIAMLAPRGSIAHSTDRKRQSELVVQASFAKAGLRNSSLNWTMFKCLALAYVLLDRIAQKAQLIQLHAQQEPSVRMLALNEKKIACFVQLATFVTPLASQLYLGHVLPDTTAVEDPILQNLLWNLQLAQTAKMLHAQLVITAQKQVTNHSHAPLACLALPRKPLPRKTAPLALKASTAKLQGFIHRPARVLLVTSAQVVPQPLHQTMATRVVSVQ